MYFIDKTKRGYTRTNNRISDLQELSREAQTNPDPGARELAKRAIHDIKNEDGSVKSMRDALIKAHRQGDTNEIKDINDIVAHKRKYRHE